jgi:hypothetical protein
MIDNLIAEYQDENEIERPFTPRKKEEDEDEENPAEKVE